MSGLHYGYYKVQYQSTTLLEVKCKLVLLAVRNATLLDRQRNSVSIILAKSTGNVYVLKLRAILLLEADFNTLNKIVFNGRALPSIEASNTISFEVIRGRKGQSFMHVALNKKLVYDIGNQHKKPIVVVSADASNCYNRITHSISSMVCQHFRLQLEYLMTLFGTIQTIKMFLYSFGVW